MNVEM